MADLSAPSVLPPFGRVSGAVPVVRGGEKRRLARSSQAAGLARESGTVGATRLFRGDRHHSNRADFSVSAFVVSEPALAPSCGAAGSGISAGQPVPFAPCDE